MAKKNIKLRAAELNKLGENIKIYRDKSGFSQENLATMSGLHRTFVSSVERGEYNISFLNLLKIAGALDITLDKLLEGISPGVVKPSPEYIKKITNSRDLEANNVPGKNEEVS